MESTTFTIKNNISGEEETVKVNKYTFTGPILIGSSAECDIVLKNTEDSVIFGQHALLGHIGHHTYLRTKRDPDGTIPAAVNEYGHLKFEEGDCRLACNYEFQNGYYSFEVGHYTIRM